MTVIVLGGLIILLIILLIGYLITDYKDVQASIELDEEELDREDQFRLGIVVQLDKINDNLNEVVSLLQELKKTGE